MNGAANNNSKTYSIASSLAALIFLIFTICLTPLAGATTVQLSDQNLVPGQQYLLYVNNSTTGLTYVGVYNTTDMLDLGSGGTAYVLVLKPSTLDYLHDPAALVNAVMNSTPLWVAVVFLLVLVALVYVAVRRTGR